MSDEKKTNAEPVQRQVSDLTINGTEVYARGTVTGYDPMDGALRLAFPPCEGVHSEDVWIPRANVQPVPRPETARVADLEKEVAHLRQVAQSRWETGVAVVRRDTIEACARIADRDDKSAWGIAAEIRRLAEPDEKGKTDAG
jgi:hypothetical protein